MGFTLLDGLYYHALDRLAVAAIARELVDGGFVAEHYLHRLFGHGRVKVEHEPEGQQVLLVQVRVVLGPAPALARTFNLLLELEYVTHVLIVAL